MNEVVELPPGQPPPHTKLSLILWLAFYVGACVAGLKLIPAILAPLFGSLFSATVGLFLLAVLANLFTMRIFDRRPLIDIGLSSNPGSGKNFTWGLLLGAGAAAVMLIAPLVAGAGHFVPRQ